ncbi:MAG: DUF5320 domain-containing protein [Candidatus Cloacimonetes bacterium]|nr:DUF5320 domain-containing protein [Candidatus Cloacimonadota bacterium]
MPRGDRTGPNGEGPMTGRRMGSCNDGTRVGVAGGRGLGRRCGGGRGFGRGFGIRGCYNAADYSPESEKKALEAEISMLRDELAAVEKRLTEIPKKD